MLSGKSPSSNTSTATEVEWPKFIVTADRRIVCVGVFITSVALMLAWGLYTQFEGGDAAIWDYLAQRILQRDVPYRDVIEIKSPASAYLSALAMLLGKAIGLRDILAVRFMQIALAGVLSTVTFLVAETYLRSRYIGLIAFLLPLSSLHFVNWMEGGTQPKLTMIVFGMLTLLLIAGDRPFWAGLCSMLSCLCWQPGLLFTGIAVLMFSRYLTSWRDQRAVKTLAGAVLPLAIVVIYFYSASALHDLWLWTIAFNFQVYAPKGVRSPAETLHHFWIVVSRVFGSDSVWFLGGFAALVLYAVLHTRSIIRSRRPLTSPDLFLDGLITAPVIYVAFCRINFQSGPDLIPVFPFFALFAAWIAIDVLRSLRTVKSVTKRVNARQLIGALPACIVLLLFLCDLIRAVNNTQTDWTLAAWDNELRLVNSLVGPDDKVFVNGPVEILFSLNKSNLNPYITWDHGKARFIADKKYGGSSERMIDEIQAGAPKLVAVSRLKNIPEASGLDEWLRRQYQKLPISGYDVWVRKE